MDMEILVEPQWHNNYKEHKKLQIILNFQHKEAIPFKRKVKLHRSWFLTKTKFN